MDPSSSTTSSVNAPLDHLAGFVAKTYGSVLLGTYLSLILYGGILHQTYRYFGAYPEDKKGLKIITSPLLNCPNRLLETVHTAACIYICYKALVTDHSDIARLENLMKRTHFGPLLMSIIIGLTQGFFARRAYVCKSSRFSYARMIADRGIPHVSVGKKYRAWIRLVAVLMFLAFGFSIGQTILRISFFVALLKRVAPGSTCVGLLMPLRHGKISATRTPWLEPCATGIAIVEDVIMTTVLILALHHSRSGIKSTDSLLNRVILYAITTGMLTSGCMILLFVTNLAFPDDIIYVGVSFVATKLYTNSLLAALNTRQSLRDVAFHPSGVKVFGSGACVCAEEAHDLPGPATGGANAVTVEFVEMAVSLKALVVVVDNIDEKGALLQMIPGEAGITSDCAESWRFPYAVKRAVALWL
ncbi:hypothetical protein BD310DRAFT_969712 [Dichomitus squalens]|uniref:DUF6534 domain-containing protein n=1 Tax=Dichomitus squalens TaxID=114155 RepID=A0A4Q9PKD4_9APHY|nr:hypothetical protein BD310DRAFT_969712 [Dichomitus squalens]